MLFGGNEAKIRETLTQFQAVRPKRLPGKPEYHHLVHSQRKQAVRQRCACQCIHVDAAPRVMVLPTRVLQSLDLIRQTLKVARPRRQGMSFTYSRPSASWTAIRQSGAAPGSEIVSLSRGLTAGLLELLKSILIMITLSGGVDPLAGVRNVLDTF